MFVYKRANLSRRIRFDKTKQNDKEKSTLKRIQEMLKKHEKKIVTALIAAWLLSGDDIDEQDISTSMTSDAEPDDIADDIADSTSETYERHIQDFAYSSLEAEAEEVGREQFDAMSEDYKDILHETENLSPPRIPETEPDMSFDDNELPPAPDIDLEPNQFSYEAFYDSWCSERAGALIRDFTDGQRDNVKTLVREALANGDSPKMLKRRLRDTVGLTQRQTEVNARYYRSVYNGLKEANPKMSDEAAAERASAAAQKMAEKQLSARAKAIARSELNAAHNEASRAYVRWCIERGLLKNVYSQWVTSGNDNVCPMCFALNGQTIPFGEEYSIPAGIPYHSGTTKGPPGHPNCCCGEIFVENGQASDGNAKIWENMSDTEKKKHINYHSDKKTYEDYKKRLGKENVPETLDKFQEMKYNNNEKWRYMQIDYNRRNVLKAHPNRALPHADTATAADSKFTEYIFNPNSKDGWAKGQAFTSRLGYDKDNYAELKNLILSNATKYPATFKQTDEHGDSYEQRMILYGKKDTPANVVVGWKSKDDATWFTTAYIREVDR